MSTKTAPEHIYLVLCDNHHCDVPFHDHAEVTWCEYKINDHDVEYIRADLSSRHVEEWKDLLTRIAEQPEIGEKFNPPSVVWHWIQEAKLLLSVVES